MMKKLSVLTISFVSLFGFALDAFGAENKLQINNLNKWGFGTVDWSTCKDFYIGDDAPCIGDSKNSCKSRSVQNPSYTDEFGIIMMVARVTSAGGARFCPIMITGRNTNRGNAWTTYHETNGSCFWLCREGYTGAECEETVSSTTSSCVSNQVSNNLFNSSKAVGSQNHQNIEDYIPNWGANNYQGCGVHKGQEHDIIFAVSKWMPSGHGAMVKPYVVRANRSGWSSMDSWIDVFPASSGSDGSYVQAKLACMVGYKPNANKSDCVAIDEFVCGSKKMCAGWDRSNLRDEAHSETTVGGCYQWRCKEKGFGLDKVGGTTCASCGSSYMDGVNPADGTCVHCEKGKVFSEDAKNKGYCADTFYADKAKMMYGSGSQSSDIEKQCWTMADVKKYKDCVMGKNN